MLIKRTRGWELPERLATPEAHYLQRRALIGAMGLGAASLALPAASFAQDKSADPSAGLYPAKRNDKYGTPTPVTTERLATTYNNFYEFGTDKSIWREAQKLEVRPWTIKVGGMVEKPFEIGIDDLLAKMQLEERVYRHRCVETWSMIVPWSGFPVRSLVELCKPLGSAKFVVMKTLSKPSVMREQRDLLYPWPYTEGLAMDEAMNDLAFIATGLYGKPIHKQNGAPLRLVAPWKYGFKNVKSIVSIEFTDKKPVSFWEKLQSSEYGFWANVNPDVRPSALEPGHGEAAGQRRTHPDADLQRLRRVRGRALHRPQSGKALHVASRLCLAAPARYNGHRPMRPREDFVKINRRYDAGRRIAASAAGLPLSKAAFAQAYPNKPIKIVVPFAAGSATDLTARGLGAKLQDILKQPVVIENKPGASPASSAPRPSRPRRPTATRC